MVADPAYLPSSNAVGGKAPGLYRRAGGAGYSILSTSRAAPHTYPHLIHLLDSAHTGGEAHDGHDSPLA